MPTTHTPCYLGTSDTAAVKGRLDNLREFAKSILDIPALRPSEVKAWHYCIEVCEKCILVIERAQAGGHLNLIEAAIQAERDMEDTV